MRDPDALVVGSFRIFCQNVNRNIALLDSILASSIDDFDIIFIQELPWWLVRNAPSGNSPEGEPVIGTAIHLDWGLIVHKSDLCNEGADNPRVAVYVHKHLKGLRPGYCWDLIDHWDILVFSCYLLLSTWTNNTLPFICSMSEWWIGLT